MADMENVVTHLQIIHTWASFALENDLSFFTMAHMERLAEWTTDTLKLLKEQEHKDRMYHALEDDWKRLKELLKEQEPVKPKSKVRHGETCQYQHWCGNCMVMLHGKPKYCPNCGRSVKWG